MAKPTVAELQLKILVRGLGEAENLRKALARVGGSEIRRNLDAQAKALLGIDSAMKKAGKSGSAFGNFLKIASRGTIIAQGLYRGFKMVGGAIAESLEPLMEFEHNMARVRAKGQLSAAEAKAAGDAVKALTGQTQYGPVAASEAAVGLAAAGRGKTLTQDLPTMLRFAQANDVNPEDATKILLGTSGQFGMQGPGDLEKIGNMMTKADQMSVLSVGQIYDTLKYIGPLAKSAKMPLSEVLSMVVSLGDQGIVGSKAGTGSRNLLSAIAAPPRRAKQAQKLLDTIGLKQSDLQEGFADIPKFLKELRARFEKFNISPAQIMAINKTLFGQYGMTSSAALMADSNETKNGQTNIQNYREQLSYVHNLMKDQAALMGGTLKNKLAQVNAEWELMQIRMGEMNLPKLNESLDKVLAFMRSSAGSEVADSLGKIGELLLRALPPAIKATEISLGKFVQYFKDVDETYGLGLFKKPESETRAVSEADEQYAEDQYVMNAVAAAQQENYWGHTAPGGQKTIDFKNPATVAAEARAEYRAKEDKRKEKEADAEAFKNLTPDAKTAIVNEVASKLLGQGFETESTKVDMAITLQSDGELTAIITNLKKGKNAPDLACGISSQ